MSAGLSDMLEIMVEAGATPEMLVEAVRKSERSQAIERAERNRPRMLRLRGLAERDGECCRYCGEVLDDLSDYHIEHVTPKCQGGSDLPENLVLSCAPCNLSKGGRTPQEWLS